VPDHPVHLELIGIDVVRVMEAAASSRGTQMVVGKFTVIKTTPGLLPLLPHVNTSGNLDSLPQLKPPDADSG
jgi:hypothetical protein